MAVVSPFAEVKPCSALQLKEAAADLDAEVAVPSSVVVAAHGLVCSNACLTISPSLLPLLS